MLVVSGSNMSGKSTLLADRGRQRRAGPGRGPGAAGRLRITPLAVGATLRMQDSLQAGRRVLRRDHPPPPAGRPGAGPTPLLFLLDEILAAPTPTTAGSGPRRWSRGLVQRGAIGLVTTHDLALTKIVERLAPHAANVHFEDQFEDGAMDFDYRMRPVSSSKSNALALMRAVGLDV